jgi:hypothetical protein
MCKATSVIRLLSYPVVQCVQARKLPLKKMDTIITWKNIVRPYPLAVNNKIEEQ